MSAPYARPFSRTDKEYLVAHSGDEVIEILQNVDAERGRTIGDAAHKRILSEHTYVQRAKQLDGLLRETRSRRGHVKNR